MTIYFSEKEDRYWIRCGNDVRWFDSSLDAEYALREIEALQAIDDEVALIAAYFHKAGLTQIAASIEARDYKKG